MSTKLVTSVFCYAIVVILASVVGSATPTECPAGERNNTCPSRNRDADYCPLTDPSRIYTSKICGLPRCVCGFNQRRDRVTQKCIPISQCPPFKCFGSNEVPNNCPLPCAAVTCKDYINNSTCPPKVGRIGVVVICQPKCVCDKGYYRDGASACVLGSQCPTQA